MSIDDFIRELQAYPAGAVVTSATVRIKLGKRTSTLSVHRPVKITANAC